MSNVHKIVIVGGGAAGLELATRLGNTLGKINLVKITLVDQNLSYIWKPLWHEVAAGRIDVSKDKTEYLAHGNEHGFKFRLGSLTGLDRESKTIILDSITTSSGVFIPKSTLHYDILVIAVGSIHNDFGTPGVNEHCLSFDSLKECNVFHDCLTMKLFELMQTDQRLLDISIIGGGSTGVELAFEINNTISKLMEYKSLLDSNIEININIIESSSSILYGLSDTIVKETMEDVTLQNIKIFTNEKVIKVDKNNVHTQSGKQIKADIKLWAAGIKAPEILTTFGLATNEKNQLLLRNTLQIVDDDFIFAIGDCANFTKKNKLLPATAQLAHQQAQFLANTLTHRIKSNESFQNFYFKARGTIISASGEKAIGELKTGKRHKVTLNKKFAYISYRFLYRRYQASLHGWLKVALLTISDFLARRIRPQIKLH